MEPAKPCAVIHNSTDRYSLLQSREDEKREKVRLRPNGQNCCDARIARTTVNTTSNAGDSKPLSTVVALTGFMGSGKTSTGRALAELLGWEFIDLDEEIERREHVSIRELFRERGEAAFREIEHKILLLCVTRCSGPVVLALGGGAFIQPDNVKFL